MSLSSERGVSLENDIATLLRKKLGARVARDKRSGAGSHQKMDLTDFFRDTPLDIEAKNHKTIKLREFWKQTVQGASLGRIPTLVVRLEDDNGGILDDLAVLRFSDLVDFIAEIQDGTKTITDLRKPIEVAGLDEVVASTVQKGAKACRNGHLLSPSRTQCFAKGCPYSAGYKAKKIKK